MSRAKELLAECTREFQKVCHGLSELRSEIVPLWTYRPINSRRPYDLEATQVQGMRIVAVIDGCELPICTYEGADIVRMLRSEEERGYLRDVLLYHRLRAGI